MMELMSFMESMGSSDIPYVAAFFIGLLMAISPCPLATNITAIAYVSKRVECGRRTLFVGLVYTLGRITAYVLLSFLIVSMGVAIQEISFFLQDFGGTFIGPFILLLGVLMIVFDRLPLDRIRGSGRLESLEKQLGERGYLGGFFLGLLFALSFCPFSAVLFFGMLLPLAIAAKDPVILPSIFAFATGLPVIVSSVVLSYCARRVGGLVSGLQKVQKAVRWIVAFVFLGVGLYYTYLAFF